MIKLNQERSSFEPWSLKKSGILSKYTTVERLTITSSFLTPIAGAITKQKGRLAAKLFQQNKKLVIFIKKLKIRHKLKN